MSTYLRPTELAKYLDEAPQKISQLRARGIITPEQDGSYEADATRVAYIRNLRAHRGEGQTHPRSSRADGAMAQASI